MKGDPLLSVLTDPGHAAALDIAGWDRLLRLARSERILARLEAHLREHGVSESLYPEGVAGMFQGARAHPKLVAARAHWELGKILSATRDLKIDLVLLKGAAYLEAGLPLAKGRIFSDLDILVPIEALKPVEESLLRAGWEHRELNAYDQRYYRQWMHEIPPLVHCQRNFEVDIHHRILPQTSRLNPRSELLLRASRPVAPRVRVLAPTDMLLHCATHLFYDGEIAWRFRELMDLHQLFTHYGKDPGVLESLPERARELGLERPLYYAVSLCSAVLCTPFPETLRLRVERLGPSALLRMLMLPSMRRVLRPIDPDARRPRVSAWLLYLRSHWLRMPPSLLLPHLARKAVRRLRRSPVAALP